MNAGAPQDAAIDIRAATADDVPDITRLLWDDEHGRDRESVARAHADAYRSAFLEIDGDPNSEMIVAALDGAVVGCLQLTIVPGMSYRGVRRALIEDVRVDPACRSRGIGGRLLNFAEARALQRGCKLIELFVHVEREAAHRFYERAGYVGAHRGFRKRLP